MNDLILHEECWEEGDVNTGNETSVTATMTAAVVNAMQENQSYPWLQPCQPMVFLPFFFLPFVPFAFLGRPGFKAFQLRLCCALAFIEPLPRR